RPRGERSQDCAPLRVPAEHGAEQTRERRFAAARVRAEGALVNRVVAHPPAKHGSRRIRFALHERPHVDSDHRMFQLRTHGRGMISSISAAPSNAMFFWKFTRWFNCCIGSFSCQYACIMKVTGTRNTRMAS